MKRHPPIRALVIDDSAYSRQRITRMLESSPLVEVVGSAGDGEEALRRAIQLEPDLVTLDLEMPRLDGFAAQQFDQQPDVIDLGQRRGMPDFAIFRGDVNLPVLKLVAAQIFPTEYEIACMKTYRSSDNHSKQSRQQPKHPPRLVRRE